MMIDRVLTKKNLLALSAVAAFLHVLLTIIPWLADSTLLFILDDVLLGVLAAAVILFFARRQAPVRPQAAQLLLIACFFWLLFACLSMTVVYNNDWVSYNKRPILNTAATVFFIFPLGCVCGREKDWPVGKALLHLLLLGGTVSIAYVLVFIFQGKTLTAPNGGAIQMKNSCLEINCHYNITGSWEMLFFLGCCLMALRSRRLWLKCVYAVSALIHYTGLVLSNSRASYYAVLAGWMAMAGIAAYLYLKRQPTRRRLLISLAVAAAAGAVYYFLRKPVFSLYAACSSPGSPAAAATRIRELSNGGKNFSSSRISIWQYSIEGIFSSFRAALFGFTPNSVSDMILQASYNRYDVAYTHNQFLEVAAAEGVPGLCLFLAWLALMLRDIYRLVFVRKNRTVLLAVPVVFLTLLLANMAEAHLIFNDHINGYAFFFLGGLLHGAVNDPPAPGALPRPRLIRTLRKRKA